MKNTTKTHYILTKKSNPYLEASRTLKTQIKPFIAKTKGKNKSNIKSKIKDLNSVINNSYKNILLNKKNEKKSYLFTPGK